MSNSLNFLKIISDNKMTKEEAVKRHKELNKKAKSAQAYYYNNDTKGIQISDKEYDDIFDRITELEEKYNINDPKSVTKTAGIPVKVEKGKEVDFGSYKFLSQAKTKNRTELLKWIKDYDCILSLKEDGSSLICFYENGNLKLTATRGNGCLEGNSLILTEDGFKTIKDIVLNKIDCKILSFNFIQNKEEFSSIYDWFINYKEENLIEIELENGNKIKVTPNHLLYCSNKNKFIKACDIEEGDDLYVCNGKV